MRRFHIRLSPRSLIRLATVAAIYRLFTTKGNRLLGQARWFPGRDRHLPKLSPIAHAEALRDADAMQAATNEGFQ